MVKSNNAEAGFWAAPHRAGFKAYIFCVMLLMKGMTLYYETCLEYVRFKARRTL